FSHSSSKFRLCVIWLSGFSRNYSAARWLWLVPNRSVVSPGGHTSGDLSLECSRAGCLWKNRAAECNLMNMVRNGRGNRVAVKEENNYGHFLAVFHAIVAAA